MIRSTLSRLRRRAAAELHDLRGWRDLLTVVDASGGAGIVAAEHAYARAALTAAMQRADDAEARAAVAEGKAVSAVQEMGLGAAELGDALEPLRDVLDGVKRWRDAKGRMVHDGKLFAPPAAVTICDAVARIHNLTEQVDELKTRTLGPSPEPAVDEDRAEVFAALATIQASLPGEVLDEQTVPPSRLAEVVAAFIRDADALRSDLDGEREAHERTTLRLRGAELAAEGFKAAHDAARAALNTIMEVMPDDMTPELDAGPRRVAEVVIGFVGRARAWRADLDTANELARTRTARAAPDVSTYAGDGVRGLAGAFRDVGTWAGLTDQDMTAIVDGAGAELAAAQADDDVVAGPMMDMADHPEIVGEALAAELRAARDAPPGPVRTYDVVSSYPTDAAVIPRMPPLSEARASELADGYAAELAAEEIIRDEEKMIGPPYDEPPLPPPEHDPAAAARDLFASPLDVLYGAGRAQALSVACPACGTPVDNPCRVRVDGQWMFHDARRRAGATREAFKGHRWGVRREVKGRVQWMTSTSLWTPVKDEAFRMDEVEARRRASKRGWQAVEL